MQEYLDMFLAWHNTLTVSEKLVFYTCDVIIGFATLLFLALLFKTLFPAKPDYCKNCSKLIHLNEEAIINMQRAHASSLDAVRSSQRECLATVESVVEAMQVEVEEDNVTRQS